MRRVAGLLDQLLEPLQRCVDLLAGDAPDGTSGHPAEHSSREVVLVGVREACAGAVLLELVDHAGVGVNGALAVPDDAPAGVVLHDLPVDVEAAAGELQTLSQLRALLQVPVRRVLEVVVDRDPVLEVLRVHDDVVDALGRSRDLDGALDLHRAASGSRDSHSASACSTARSNERGAMPYSCGASSGSRGSMSDSRLSMSGRTSSSGCSVIAATRALAGGVCDRL